MSNFEYILYVLTVGAWLVNEWRKEKRLKKKIDPKAFESAYNIDGKVYPVLYHLLMVLKAQRVYIIQFHNGEHFYSGQSIQRYSISHEVVRPGASPLRRSYINIPITFRMHELIKQLKREGMTSTTLADINEGDTHLKDFLLLYNSRSSFDYHITDINQRTIGILSIHFTVDDPMDEVEHLKVEHSINQIRNILTSKP